MGKGSSRRKEDASKIRDNWDAIFGKKEEPKQDKSKEVPDSKETK